MKALLYTKYGASEILSQRDVPQLKEVEKPVFKDNEVLLKVFKSYIAGLGGAFMAIPLGKEKF